MCPLLLARHRLHVASQLNYAASLCVRLSGRRRALRSIDAVGLLLVPAQPSLSALAPHNVLRAQELRAVHHRSLRRITRKRRRHKSAMDALPVRACIRCSRRKLHASMPSEYVQCCWLIPCSTQSASTRYGPSQSSADASGTGTDLLRRPKLLAGLRVGVNLAMAEGGKFETGEW